MGLTSRDLTVLLTVTVIALVSFHWEASFEFHPQHVIPLKQSADGPVSEFSNIPEPIIIDYDGDRQNEVIMAFDRMISVRRWSRQRNELVELSRYVTPYQPLLMTYIGPESRPKGFTGAQLMPYVLILTDVDYRVICVSYPDLKEVWATKVPGIARHVKKFDNVALADHTMVADYSALYKGDIGAVFLALRFDSRLNVGQVQGTEDGEVTNLDVANAGTEKATVMKLENHPTLSPATHVVQADRDEERALEYITHVSFWALDLTTGKIRWRHTAKDEHRKTNLNGLDIDATYGEDDQEEMSQFDHDYRRHIAERKQHFEEGNWRIWKEDLIDLGLPHQWYTTRHTSMTPVRFNTNRDTTLTATTKKRHVPQFNTGDNFEDPYRYLEHTYQHAATKSANNILLYENSEGVTVIHLYTGQILTRLPLPAFRTFADANGDGTINSLAIDAEHGLLRMSTMYEEQRTLNQSQIYTSRLPRHTPTLQSIHRDAPSLPVEFAPPLLLQASTRFTGPGSGLRSPIGKTLAQILPDLDRHYIPDQAYYMILLNSLGYMYCIRSDTGELQWMVETGAGWAQMQALRNAIRGRPGRTTNPLRAMRGGVQHGLFGGEALAGRQMDRPEDSRFEKKLSGLLMPFAIDAKETHPTGVLAVSPAGLVLVGPDGAILARQETNLPAVSKTTLPVLADLTSDGRNDILLVTHRAYHIYILSSGKSHIYPLLVACFLLLLLAIAAYQLYLHRKRSRDEVVQERSVDAHFHGKLI